MKNLLLLRVVLKNLDTNCDFEIAGIELVKQNKDWIEVKYNVLENDFYEPYLYERSRYEIVSIIPYKD